MTFFRHVQIFTDVIPESNNDNLAKLNRKHMLLLLFKSSNQNGGVRVKQEAAVEYWCEREKATQDELLTNYWKRH